MKRLVAFVTLSVALAIAMTGCAHKQLTRAQVATHAAGAVAVAAVVFFAVTNRCGDCTFDGMGGAAR